MIQGFLNIIYSLLVFASLFSAVVTIFVAQTSQALQPDTAQIMIALLSENNQLLRAAGNRTTISTVPATFPGIEGRTYTSIDVWVNGLFFTSLALSLSTALLSVLAKQWIQAYTAFVPGSARTRVLIRHFRFQGLTQWGLSDIIETFPLILHISVAIFLVGLALYVSQLSSGICGVVSGIAILTFQFYFGTSMIPAFDIVCPYRIPVLYSITQPLVFAFHVARYAVLRLWNKLSKHYKEVTWPKMSKQALKTEESNHALVLQKTTDRLTCDSLNWIYHLSSNNSVKYVVIEGACPLLKEWRSNNIFLHSFLHAVKYSLSQLPYTPIQEDDLEQNSYVNFIDNIIKDNFSKYMDDEPVTEFKIGWREEVERPLVKAYHSAVARKYHALSSRILDWGYTYSTTPGEYYFGQKALEKCAMHGDNKMICDLVDRGMDLKHRNFTGDYTTLHWAVWANNVQGVVALLQHEPSLISMQANCEDRHAAYLKNETCTALDIAIVKGFGDVVPYLVEAGAQPRSNALHTALLSDFMDEPTRLVMVELLLDHGFDRTTEETMYDVTPFDLAQIMGHDGVVEHFKNYQTVGRYPPPHPTPDNAEETYKSSVESS